MASLLTELYCNSVFGNLYKLNISKPGDASVTELTRNIPLNSLKFRKYNAGSIKGTSVEFTIREEVDFEFIQFFSSIPKTFLVSLYNETTRIWRGYINTNQYDAPYKPCPNNLTFVASDGLGLLKKYRFTLTGNNSEFACIRHCIDKITDQQLSYAVAISVYEQSFTYSDRSPLEQTFIDCNLFAGLTCYDVIVNILKRYDAEITQDNDRWLIRSSIDKKSNMAIYDWQGTYESVVQAGDVLELNSPRDAGDVYPIGFLRHSLIPCYNRFSFFHDYGLKDSMLPNYLFDKYTPVSEYDREITALENWVITDPASTFSLHHKGVGNTGYRGVDNWVYLYGTANVSNQAYIHTSVAVTHIAGQEFNFRVLACPVGTSDMTVKTMVKLVSSGTDYYLTTSGWTTTPSYISSVLQTVGFENSDPLWQDIEILSGEDLPGSGTLYVYLIQYRSLDDAGGDPKGVMFFKPQVWFSLSGATYEPDLDVIVEIDNSTGRDDMEDQILFYSDAPAEENNELLYENITRLTAGGIPTSSWRFQGGYHSFTHQEMFMKLLASRNRTALQKLTGIIKGSRLGFSSIIKHTYNSNREFEIIEDVWDMYSEHHTVTLSEILSFSDEDITLIDILNRETELASGIAVEDVTLEHIDTVADGIDEVGDPVTVTFEATVAAGYGPVTIYWQLRNSALAVVDSGNNSVNMDEGTATYTLEGVVYPALGYDYTLQISLDGTNWTDTSNQFDSLA